MSRPAEGVRVWHWPKAGRLHSGPEECRDVWHQIERAGRLLGEPHTGYLLYPLRDVVLVSTHSTVSRRRASSTLQAVDPQPLVV